MMRLKNKKAQTEWYVIGVIIALILLFGVGYWLWSISSGASSTLKTIKPDILDAYTQLTCSPAISANLLNTFCQYKEVQIENSNDPIYVNCLYPQVQEALKASGLGTTEMDCSSDSFKPETFCKQLQAGNPNLKSVLIYSGTTKFNCPENLSKVTPA
jgi:hypothetical protein